MAGMVYRAELGMVLKYELGGVAVAAAGTGSVVSGGTGFVKAFNADELVGAGKSLKGPGTVPAGRVLISDI